MALCVISLLEIICNVKKNMIIINVHKHKIICNKQIEKRQQQSRRD